jgi:mitogen-activated protein kinase 1/3/mitogen-activated protein kinase 6
MPVNAIGQEWRSFVVQGTRFEVENRYNVLNTMGQGAYGVVCAVQDDVLGTQVAVKKIESAFEHMTFARRTVRELKILRCLNHENVLRIEKIFLPSSREEFNDIYVFSELLETDLTSILKSSQPLSDEHVQFFLYQVLRGMKYVHSAGIIHRDLKPRNLLVNANCDLKICDFGLARFIPEEEGFLVGQMTEYVCTRWYRAPEVLCCIPEYEPRLDIWSIGCIFAEMLGRKPLFPGNNTQHQLQLILALIGSPPEEFVAAIRNLRAQEYLRSLPDTSARPFEELYPEATAVAITLLKEFLVFLPAGRMTVSAALGHPYLASLSCPEDEPERAPLNPREFEFDRRKVDMELLRDEMYREMLEYYPELRDQFLAQTPLLDVLNYRLLEPGETQNEDEP